MGFIQHMCYVMCIYNCVDILFLLHEVLFFHLDRLDMSCLVFKILAVETLSSLKYSRPKRCVVCGV